MTIDPMIVAASIGCLCIAAYTYYSLRPQWKLHKAGQDEGPPRGPVQEPIPGPPPASIIDDKPGVDLQYKLRESGLFSSVCQCKHLLEDHRLLYDLGCDECDCTFYVDTGTIGSTMTGKRYYSKEEIDGIKRDKGRITQDDEEN